MELLIKASAVGIAAGLICLVIKKSNPELSAVLGAAAAVSICFAAVSFTAHLRELAELIKSMTSSGELFIAPVMKCAAIAIVTKLASELCRDSSQSAVASSVELAGSICALSVAMPLIISMLKTIGAMA